MAESALPISLWGVDPVFWSAVRLFISDIHAIKDYSFLPGTSYCLNGVHPIHKVSIIGIAVDVKLHATNTSIFVDDGTGIILATQWHNGDQNPMQNYLGRLLSITGKLSTYRGEHQIRILSIDQVLDPNIEVLNWMQSIYFQKTIYQEVDPIVKTSLENLSTAEVRTTTFLEREGTMDPWELVQRACIDLISSSHEVRFIDLCSDPNLAALVRDRFPQTSSSRHDISIIISKSIKRCVSQGLIVQRCPERDSYVRLDVNTVCQIIVDELQPYRNIPMTLTEVIAKIRHRQQYAGIQYQMLKESIRILEKKEVVRRQSINTFMLI